MRRLIIYLTCLLLIDLATPAGAEIFEGRFVFNKRCATCHDITTVMAPLMKLRNDAERRAYLEKFLSRHHAYSDEERALIIDYLLRHPPRLTGLSFDMRN